jgi:hypothetical protein
LVTVWVVVVTFFGVLLTVSRAAESPLDDRDPAFQRPGFLDAGDLPQPAPSLPQITFAGRRTVVFFQRHESLAELCQTLEREPFDDDVQLVVAVSGETPHDCPRADVVLPDREVADRFGIRMPRGGGPPVGYAVVDADRMIRYRTLDPAVPSLIDEVRTIVGALE